ncbi:InlB B-repeat-containing protein [Fibrobacter sp.]|uniref:InlB B-repeat-containing protein n=1 Tax=Fibrobacter sp. TaxID=35828 RepID=UPI00386F334B
MKRFLILALTAVAYAARTIVPSAPALESDGCYAISTAEELYGFADIVNASEVKTECGKLTRNIVVNKRNQDEGISDWIPIQIFSGTFDGQGHTIVGLRHQNWTTNVEPALPNAGLFGVVSNRDSQSPVYIKNLVLEDVNFFDIDNGGGLIGKIDSLSKEVVIENCDVEISTGVSRLEEDLRGYRGGLVGLHQGGILTIKESHVVSYFYGAGSNAGLVGGTTGTVRISNSYCHNNFSSAAEASLVGKVTNANVHIENSYALSRFIPSDSWEGVYNIVGETENSYVKYSNVFRMYSPFSRNNSLEGVHEFYDEQIEDGTIANVLHLFKSGNTDGSVWGQNVGTDVHPTLSGKIDGGPSLKLSALHLITYDADTVTYSKQYVEGIESSLPLPERKDYEFAGWYDNENFYGKSTTTIPKDATGDKTFYAKWWHIPKFINNCYEIALMDELYYFANLYNNQQYPKSTCVKLTADLVDNKKVIVEGKLNSADSLKLYTWTPIQKFKGTFDGQGHSISGLFYVGDYESKNAGLLGSVGEKNDVTDVVVIKNLGIKDSYFEGRRKSGSLVGESASGTNLYVYNVFSECVINSWNSDNGGLIGAFNLESEKQSLLYLVNAYHKGYVSGYDYVGGLVGSIEDTKAWTMQEFNKRVA